MDLQTILTAVESWSVQDRIRLVQELWNEIAEKSHDRELSDDLKAELDRRLAAHRANPDAALPWDQVEAEALARLQG